MTIREPGIANVPASLRRHSRKVFGLLAAALLSSGPAFSAPDTGKIDGTERYRQLEVFGQAFDEIRKNSINAPDDTALVRSALERMLSSLDPYSTYHSPESFTKVREKNDGAFGGLGVEVTLDGGTVKVVAPYDDGPATRAGILANDRIVKVDGQEIAGKALEAVVALMRGEPGSTVDLTIRRDGVDRPLVLTLTRDVVTVEAVHLDRERGVPVIRLSTFSEQTFPGLDKAIRKLVAEGSVAPPKGIVLDMRNNGGGLVDQSEFVADAFLARGSIVHIVGRNAGDTSRFDARPDDLDRMIAGVPVVVLVNGGTASAAEIVAGALQDHRRATLVGTRSFGKGLVQTLIPLGADGAIRLTTARFYTPSNRSIQAVGIAPDIEVRQHVPDDLLAQGDSAEAAASAYVPADRADDTQLQYAVDLILGHERNAAFPAAETSDGERQATNRQMPFGATPGP